MGEGEMTFSTLMVCIIQPEREAHPNVERSLQRARAAARQDQTIKARCRGAAG
jgi:hypothetical protein